MEACLNSCLRTSLAIWSSWMSIAEGDGVDCGIELGTPLQFVSGSAVSASRSCSRTVSIASSLEMSWIAGVRGNDGDRSLGSTENVIDELGGITGWVALKEQCLVCVVFSKKFLKDDPHWEHTNMVFGSRKARDLEYTEGCHQVEVLKRKGQGDQTP